jgi:hypothetical protein
MPVKFHMPTAEDYAKTDSRFDACVRRLAPVIRELREDRARRSTRKLVERLNELGEVGPKGKALNYGTMRRILLRLPKLHLGPGPSSQSLAASDRVTPYFPRHRSTPVATSLALALLAVAEAEALQKRRLDH